MVFSFLTASCTTIYHIKIPSPREGFRIDHLQDLPYREFWSGCVFDGEKIGFSHMKISFQEKEQLFLISSESYLVMRFWGVETRTIVKSEDLVRPDLTLVSFQYRQVVDEKTLTIQGEFRGGNFRAVLQTGDLTKSIENRIEEPLYPMSAVNLVPLLQGMAIGSTHHYLSFDPQTQSFIEVLQEVKALEENPIRKLEPAYKIDTNLIGYNVSSWINLRGETVFELAMGGALVTYQEDEEKAKQYFSPTSSNIKDFILDFALVKTDKSLLCPREATFLAVVLEEGSEPIPIIQGPGQIVLEKKEEGPARRVEYRIRGGLDDPADLIPEPLDDLNPYLSATIHIESDHPEIKKKAAEIVGEATSPLEKVRRITRWVSAEVKDELVDCISALEVLHTLRGECQSHTLLYTALSRAAGIPTRLAGGLVYSEGQGFLYHAWAESYVGGWMAIDPTFNQVGADATHIKLEEGSSWTALLQVGNVVGRLKARIIEYQAHCLY